MAFTKIAAAGIGSTGTVTLQNVVVTGSITASLTGTATSTTNIPNLTGAITSNNTTTSLGSFSSANLATALSDKTGSGANVFATSPVLVTPSLGIATASSLVVSGIITATQLSTGASGTGVNISTDTISGPATLTIDPAAVGDNTGAVRIKGDLYVDGTQFIVNSTTIELADFNVGIASTVGTNALLDGAGIGIGSIGIRKTLTWNNSSTALKSSEDFDISSGKVYRVNGTSVLSNNTLGSGVVTSSLTSVGTLGQLQVTGISTFTNGPILVGTATSTGTASQPLQVTGGAYVSGSVGIGTANPLDPLHLQGIFRIDRQLSAQDQTYIRYFRQGTEKARFGLLAADNAIFFNATATDSANHLVINSSGNVLVGSSSATGTASQRLQVTGGAYVSGSVGIGTAIPAKKLHVQTSFVSGAARGGGFTQILFESNQASATYWEFQANASSTNDILFSKSGTGGSSYGVVGYDHATEALRFYTNSAERVRIDSSGNVGIGITNPARKLDVRGEATFGSGITASDLSWGKDTNQLVYTFSGTASGTNPADGCIAIVNPNANPSGSRVGSLVYGNKVSGTEVTLNPGIKAVIECYTNTNVANAADTGAYLNFYTKPDNANNRVQMTLNSNGVLTKPYQPAFLAYRNSTLSVTGGTWQNISSGMLTESYDVGSVYSTSTNGRFVAPVAGKYMFYAGGYSVGNTSGERYAFGVKINNVGGPDFITGGNYCITDTPLVPYQIVLNLAANDYVELYYFSAISTTIGGTPHVLYWGGYLLG